MHPISWNDILCLYINKKNKENIWIEKFNSETYK